jgi:hypothetical protein
MQPFAKNRMKDELSRIVPGFGVVTRKEKAGLSGKRRDVCRIMGVRLVDDL